MNIADLARVRDEDLAATPAGDASGAGARALMESIMAGEREPARRRRLPVRRALGLGAAVAGLAAAFVVWTPSPGPAAEYANAAVSLRTGPRTDGADYIEVEINDPGAGAAEFTEAFRAVGLDAEVRAAPVAPQDVGKLIGPHTDGEFPRGTGVTVSTRTEGCGSAWCGKVSVPVGLTGKVVFGIGRPAAPGELYATSAVVEYDPGNGPIDGYRPVGKPVAQVRADMERAGMKVGYVVMWRAPDGSGSGYHVDAAHVRDGWPVGSVRRIASDAVTVSVDAPADVPEGSLPRIRPPDPSGWWRD